MVLFSRLIQTSDDTKHQISSDMAEYVRYELYEVWTSLCILLSVADSFKLVVASSFGGKHIRASVCDYGDAGSLEVSPFLKNSWAKLFFWK